MLASEARFHEQRVSRFVEYLPNLFYPESVLLDITGTVDPDPIPFERLGTRHFRSFCEGEVWGENWSSGWFRLQGTVPADWAGRIVVARLNFGGESCVFSEAGEPLHGLTGGSVFARNFRRERYRLFEPCAGSETVNLLVEAAANSMFGVGRERDPVPDSAFSEPPEGIIKTARLAVFDEDVHKAWLDMNLLHRLMMNLPERDPWRARILHTLTQAVDCFTYDSPNPDDLRMLCSPLLDTRSSEAALQANAVGHAHIDTAWLWPMRETIRKTGRTFATQLNLLDTYPEYVFGASQAQHYQFVKDRYPELYERVKQAVADGRWEPQGAMWVEADCNVTGGESLARQILYGKKFFQDEFGVDVRHLWLPDVFGFSAALPQILQHGGVTSFVTQKLSWSQFNTFPHHTFCWQGIDGSSVLTHFPPEGTYNSQLGPDNLRRAADKFEERGMLPEFLTLFGIGDGGGGPSEEHIECGRREADIAGCPNVTFDKAQPFLDRLMAYWDQLPVWQGELYLELHRGTLTTHARNKRFNRKLERQLRLTEMLWSCLPCGDYPSEQLEACWKTMLTNQFHDIIPGSSITRVYEDTRKDYERGFETTDALIADALKKLTADGSGRNRVTVFNPLSHTVKTAVRLPNAAGDVLQLGNGGTLPLQRCEDGTSWACLELKPLQVVHGTLASGAAAEGAAPAPAVHAEKGVLENELVRYEFDDAGRVVSAFDKQQQRDFITAEEPGNQLVLYEDWPVKFDAWDIDMPYPNQLRDRARVSTIKVSAAGPVVGELTVEADIGISRIKQRIRLAANSKRLDFDTDVDWHECRKMLRVQFPVDIRAMEATYEIQFGTLKRPTHENTPWDKAKFEVCGHGFADLSDNEHGVALLNDCKYGYRAKGNTLDMNLLRSPYFPDATADRGQHTFTYSLLPHNGVLAECADVFAEAHVLNQPPVVCPGEVDLQLPFVYAGDGVVLETVKKAERRDAWVVRLYEPAGKTASCRLTPDGTGVRVWDAGLMEEPDGEIPVGDDGAATIAFQPYQIRTLLLADRDALD